MRTLRKTWARMLDHPNSLQQGSDTHRGVVCIPKMTLVLKTRIAENIRNHTLDIPKSPCDCCSHWLCDRYNLLGCWPIAYVSSFILVVSFEIGSSMKPTLPLKPGSLCLSLLSVISTNPQIWPVYLFICVVLTTRLKVLRKALCHWTTSSDTCFSLLSNLVDGTN